MPATVKMFAADHRAMLPSPWMEAVGNTHHARQGTLIVMATAKKDVDALLTDRGLSQFQADALAKGARKVSHVSLGEQLLLDAGVIDPNAVDVYVYRRMTNGQPVARIDHHGNLTIVAHFRFDGAHGGRGLWVEPVTA